MSLEPGQVIGKYRIDRTLGQGALAVTFRVVDPADGQPYALKMMYSRDDQFRERLKRAGEAQSSALSPNLVRVVEMIEVEGAPGLVMEYVDGPSLEDWLKQGRPALRRALEVFRGLLDGIEVAHEAGLVHRNLKPAKILLQTAPDGYVAKINDFALVKMENAQKAGKALTQLGVSFGTPQYMAPEQFRDVSGVDHRADLFALGAILYEMVCGVRAYDGNNLLAIYQKSAQGQLRPPRELVPDLPPTVVTAIERCLKVDPKLRPASAGELRSLMFGGGALDAALAGPTEPPAAAPPAVVVDASPPAPAAPAQTPVPATPAARTPAPAAARTPAPAASRTPAPAASRTPAPARGREAVSAAATTQRYWIIAAIAVVVLALPLVGAAVAFAVLYLMNAS
jgi:serine/threonine protein kinase